jgi:hypothetical protein
MKIDMNLKKSDDLTTDYRIVLHAQNKSILGKSPGHLFVEYIKIVNGQSISQGIWGFYPKGIYTYDDFKNGVVVEGQFQTDLDTPQDESYLLNLDKRRYDIAWRVRTDWTSSSRPYQAGVYDCISFVFEVAKEIGLSTPNRPSKGTFPDDMLVLLKQAN